MPTREEIEIAQETLLDDNAPIGSIMPSEDLGVRQMTLDYIDQQNTYKSYVVEISQSGTATPAISQMFINQLGGTPVLARTGVGTYTLTLSNAFVINKTVTFPKDICLIASITDGFANNVSISKQDASVILIDTFSNGAPSDSILDRFPIEIRVYN